LIFQQSFGGIGGRFRERISGLSGAAREELATDVSGGDRKD
jgi:hypothetical protein